MVSRFALTALVLAACEAGVQPGSAGTTTGGELSTSSGGTTTTEGATTDSPSSTGVSEGTTSGGVTSIGSAETGFWGSSSSTGEAAECVGDDVTLSVSMGEIEPEEQNPLLIDASCEVADVHTFEVRPLFSTRYVLACDEGEASPTERSVTVRSSEAYHYPLQPGTVVRLRLEKWFSVDYGGREYLSVTSQEGDVLLGRLTRPHGVSPETESDGWFPMTYSLLDDVCPTVEAEPPKDGSNFIVDPCLGDSTPLGVALQWDGQDVMVPAYSTVDVDGLSIYMHATRQDFVERFTPCGSDGDFLTAYMVRRGDGSDDGG